MSTQASQPLCPDCGGELHLKKSRGRHYRCPKCGHACPEYHHDGRALGPMDQCTKTARRMAHTQFDRLWQERKDGSFSSRDAAYGWLSHQLGIPRSRCHMALFDLDTCLQVVTICARRLRDAGRSV